MGDGDGAVEERRGMRVCEGCCECYRCGGVEGREAHRLIQRLPGTWGKEVGSL